MSKSYTVNSVKLGVPFAFIITKSEGLLMSAALRQEQHLKGKTFIQRGDYLTALEILQNAKSQFGPHLGLLCDILCCHYCVGNVYELKNYIKYILNELEKASLIISPDTQVRTLIFISKMLEEVGSLDAALNNYIKANDHVEKLTGESQVRGRILTSAQILRLSLLNGIDGKLLSQHYNVCYKLQTDSVKLSIELEHSLMLYEVQNLSVLLAKRRVEKIIQDAIVPELQKRLVVFDFVYECLVKNINVDGCKLLFQKLEMNNFDIYEQFIYKVIHSESIDIDDCLQIKKDSTILNWFRASQIFCTSTIQSNEKIQLIKNLSFEDLKQLDHLDQKNIKKMFNQLFSVNKSMTLYLDKNKVCISNQSIELNTNSFTYKVLKYFSASNHSTIDMFVKNIYEADYNQSYYERTRTALNRFNKDMQNIIGIEKVILIQKNKGEYILSLSNSVNIQEVSL